MSAIGPGTMLVCVDADGCLAPLEVGRAYECREVVPTFQRCTRDGCGSVGVILREITPRTSGKYGERTECLCPNRFVPSGRRGMFNGPLMAEHPHDEYAEAVLAQEDAGRWGCP